MRVAPKVWIGLAIAVGYIAVAFSIQVLSGIPYDEWGDSGHNLFFGAGISLIIGAALLAGLTTWLGWWRPALRDEQRSRVRWPIIAPAIMVLLAILTLIGTDWSAYSMGFLAASLVLLLVGFTEEITYRGLLVVGLRSRFSEVWVWFLSSAIFGATHLVNILLGQEVGATILQVIFAFGAGSAFYIVRRVTGSLVPAMILHGVWDFAQFASGVGEESDLANFAIGIYVWVFPLALIGGLVVALKTPRDTA